VTPPSQPIQVPADEAQSMPELSRYRGYNGSTSGEDFGAVGATP